MTELITLSPTCPVFGDFTVFTVFFPQTIRADLTIVADGCFSRFRKDLTDGSVSVASNFAGLIMNNCPQYKANHAEIVLGDTGPILVYQIASNDTRILVDIKGKMPSNPKEYMMTKVLSQLPGIYNLYKG